MDLPRTARYVGELIAVAGVAALGAMGASDLLAQPPRPHGPLDWLLIVFTIALVLASLILTVLLGLALLRAGYPKTPAGVLPARLLLIGGVVIALASLGLSYFGRLSGRDVLFFIGAALLSAWLSYDRYTEISAPDA